MACISGVCDKIGKYTYKLLDLKGLLDLNIKNCFLRLNKLDKCIQSVDELLIRQIMVCHFINVYSWTKTS